MAEYSLNPEKFKLVNETIKAANNLSEQFPMDRIVNLCKIYKDEHEVMALLL